MKRIMKRLKNNGIMHPDSDVKFVSGYAEQNTDITTECR